VIENDADKRLKEIEKTPANIISDKATTQRKIISQAKTELIQVRKEIVISSEVNKIIQDLDAKKLIAPSYFNNNIVWVLSGHITNDAFLTSYHSFVNQGLIHAPIAEPITVTPPPEQKNIYWIIKSTPPDRSGKQIEVTASGKIQLEGQGWVFSLTEPDPEPKPDEPKPDEPKPDEPDITITDNMVTQQLINFNIVNGRAVGSIKFVATNNFNPYYYGKNIVNAIQFHSPNGVPILDVVKINTLNFTETEREEIILYDEDVKQHIRATTESVVWPNTTTTTAFSKAFNIEISEKEPPKPLTPGFMGAGIAGAIAGLVLIGFIADHKRGN